MKKCVGLVKYLGLLLFLSASYGQDDDLIERAWDFGIGIGFGEQSNPFVAADAVPTYITFDIAIYGKRFFFDNGDVGFTLVDRDGYGLNLIATYSNERIYYSFFNALGLVRPDLSNTSPRPPESAIVTEVVTPDTLINPGFLFFDLDFPDRDFAVNSGFELLWNKPFGSFQIQALTDISNKHKGQEFSIEYSKAWGKGRWRFQPSFGINWKSRELVDYYYGLDMSNSGTGFTYRGESVVNYSGGLVSSYRINNHVSLVASLKYNRFGSAIRNSPLVVDDSSRSFFAGVFYSF